MNRMRRAGRVLLIAPLAIGGLILFIWLVMLLWNGVLTEATGVRTITFWQAAGIFALSKILFGFNMGGGRRRKFRNMSPEEKEKFKAKWEEKCGRWGRKDEPPTSFAE